MMRGTAMRRVGTVTCLLTACLLAGPAAVADPPVDVGNAPTGIEANGGDGNAGGPSGSGTTSGDPDGSTGSEGTPQQTSSGGQPQGYTHYGVGLSETPDGEPCWQIEAVGGQAAPASEYQTVGSAEQLLDDFDHNGTLYDACPPDEQITFDPAAAAEQFWSENVT
ncbi:MAG: hypothetical protein ACRDU8_08180, partial [Egibacteraceae bacterium]